MDLKPLTHDDLPAIPAMQPPGWRGVARWFAWYLHNSLCEPVKVEIDSELAAVGASIRFPGTGWIAHIIVRPEFRRRGIATAIVEHLVAGLRSRGSATISLVATSEGYSVYERLGFVLQATYALMERPPGSDPLQGVSSQAVNPAIEDAHPDDTAAILALDREVSGEERSVLYPGFAAGNMHGIKLVRARGVAAFLCEELGDGLMIARDEESARALLWYRAATAERIGIPESNRTGIEQVESLGFRRFRSASRMVLGAPFPWKAQWLYGRIGGNLG